MTLRQREPRERNEAFLAFVRTHACVSCGEPAPSQAAHVRYSDAAHGRTNPGVGCKPSDRFCVPLCPTCHTDGNGAQHRTGERRFWLRAGKDPFKIAKSLYARFLADGGAESEGPNPRKRRPVMTDKPKTKRKWASRPFPKRSKQ